MKIDRTCPKCRAALSDDALHGLCHRCLGRLAFGLSGLADAGAGAGAEPGQAPHRFGDYELLEEIARGGMGVVYRARQVSLNRLVAVKMILHGPFSSEASVQRFRNEALAAAALQHPSIVAIHEVGHLEGQHFFSMEYIAGKSLSELVCDGPLPGRRAAGYLQRIAEAIEYAHGEGVLHRDLKPSNVLLDVFDQPKVMDFGLAKLLTSDSELTTTGQMLGSPAYMPPEQVGGRNAAAGPEGDVYSLGAVLYHLVTGRPPFQGETVPEVLWQVQNTEPVPPRRLNAAVPLDLQTIGLKCLQKDPARRYHSARALAEDLGRFLAGEPILARPMTGTQKVWLWCRRRPLIAALSASLALAVLLGLGGVVWEWRRAESHAEGESQLRRLAEDHAARLRLNLYAADISLAAQSMRDGDYGLARRVLLGLQPRPSEPDLRGFEWRYLWQRCTGNHLATLAGHAWIVTCVAFSPDGRLVVSGAQDGKLNVWDARRHELLTSLPGGYDVIWSLAFTGDGRMLMSAGLNAGVKFWRTNTWQPVTNFPGQLAALAGFRPLVATSESSPFVSGPSGKVAIWNYQTGEKLLELPEHGRALAFSPDGRVLAVAGVRTGVGFWDAGSGNLLRRLPTEQSVWCLNFSPAGDRLVTAGWTNEASVWDLSTQAPPRQIKGHSRPVWSAAFSPDGRTIYTTASDQTARSWDAATLNEKDVFRGHDNEVWCAALSPDGEMLVTGGKDQTVRLWPSRLPSDPGDLPHDSGFTPVISPDGSKILVWPSGRSGAGPELWDVRAHRSLAKLEFAQAFGFSTEGQSVMFFKSGEAVLKHWAPEPAACRTVKLEMPGPGSLAAVQAGFSPGGREFFAVDGSGVIRVWDAAKGSLLWSARGPVPPVRKAVLGPGAAQVAVSTERDSLVRVYERGSGRELKLEGHRDFVSGIDFSPDGTTIATGSMDGTIRLWRAGTGEELAQLPGHMDETTDLAFSPDGKTLASVGVQDSIKLWHLPTRRELLSLDDPQTGTSLRFSPDGKRLAVTRQDRSVRLLEAPGPADTEAQPAQPPRAERPDSL